MAVTSIKNKIKSGSLLVGNSYYVPPSFESIATVTVGAGGSSSITFSSIPSTYKHLQIRGIIRDTGGAPATVIQFNSDTGSNYKSHYLSGDGASAIAGSPATVTYGYLGYPTPYTANSSMFGAFVIDILDYANTSKYKTTRSLNGYDTNNTATGYVSLFSNLWMNTAAISTITLTNQGNTIAQYSQFALYGVKG